MDTYPGLRSAIGKLVATPGDVWNTVAIAHYQIFPIEDLAWISHNRTPASIDSP